MPVITIDSPVGGINAFDSPENMAPTDAIALQNWIPRSGYLESRPPTGVHLNLSGVGMGTGCYLITYHGIAGQQLIAIGNGGTAYNVSAGTQVSVGTGFANMTYTVSFHINDVLIVMGGAYKEKAYNGTTFTDLDYTGSSPSIITTGAFTAGCNFKGRAIYINSGRTDVGTPLTAVNSFWYAEAGSYQGNITEFPLDSVSLYGGTPKAIGVWTKDTGAGPDDILVLYYTTGEVILYQGDDPGDADNWELIGNFRIAPPQSKTAMCQYGSDLLLLSTKGYVNLTDVLRTDQRSDYPAFSRRVWAQIADYASTYGGVFTDLNQAILWEDSLLLFVVAISGAGGSRPVFVLNTSTGAWSRFTQLGDPINCAVFNEVLYFGGSSIILKFGTWATATETITMSATPAFSDLGDPTGQKQITAAQFMTNHPDPKLIEVTGYSDFNLEGSLPTPTAYAGGGAPSEATVGTYPVARKAMAHVFTRGWQNLSAFGYYVSMAVQMATNDRTLYWRATNIRYRKFGTRRNTGQK